MSIIGTFSKSESGFSGSIKTATLNFKARLVESEPASENAPDYRVYTGPAEIGAGWKRTADNGRDYVSLKLDDPSFPHPIYASLFQDEHPDTYNLLWTRPQSK
ncbi:DUF736 domain-containing protein [Asticcacaulis machinosus]|uniref:DUF736 domain-containing protein n=1 Tax=Asticcacaulis machinosus TaxID=2984211 RepID=A0ABT5HFY6_9CAUL|nr:DUF736 domain-containing protein [Asticcacaulis machinosus]MDC7675167.1 DUF736 domain-containing protein [Asticcacaulis machinosus]